MQCSTRLLLRTGGLEHLFHYKHDRPILPERLDGILTQEAVWTPREGDGASHRVSAPFRVRILQQSKLDLGSLSDMPPFDIVVYGATGCAQVFLF